VAPAVFTVCRQGLTTASNWENQKMFPVVRPVSHIRRAIPEHMWWRGIVHLFEEELLCQLHPPLRCYCRHCAHRRESGRRHKTKLTIL
jgi:hypothetical protein